MPPARKRAVAKKTAAKKAAAPRQTQTEKAVEAALKVYKTRVADQVKHYKETGDLCDEEFHKIRTNLDLEEHLSGEKDVKFQIDYRGAVEMNGGCGRPEDHANEIANELLKVLELGVKIRCLASEATVKFSGVDTYDSTIEDW